RGMTAWFHRVMEVARFRSVALCAGAHKRSIETARILRVSVRFRPDGGKGATRLSIRPVLDEPGVGGLAFPLGNLHFGLVLGQPVAFLHLARELVATARHDIPVVAGQFAPLFLGLAGQLLPAALNAFPVHGVASHSNWSGRSCARALLARG